MRFVDQAVILIEAGKGGDGCRHFRREKFVPKGGPDGGDGGRGGDVIIRASNRSRSLLDYHHRKLHKAESGQPGGTARKTGRSGDHLYLDVPPGTTLYDDETGEFLGDLVSDGQEIVVAVGGKGGWGNVHFKSSRRQAPERANPGLAGDARTLRMELKLLADVALVGVPNAGKSTLITTISAAKAEIAAYPFTTLTPNLGVVRHRGMVFTVADVPGLIEGAAKGAGLGARFLRHVERCRALVYLLAVGAPQSPGDQWRMLRAELAEHDPELLQRAAVIVLSKADIVGADIEDVVAEVQQDIGRNDILTISSATRSGLAQLLDAMATNIRSEPHSSSQAWDPLADH